MSKSMRPFEDIKASVTYAIGKTPHTQLLDDMISLVAYVEDARRERDAERAESARLRQLLSEFRT